MMAKRGLITDADRRNFLEQKYEEMLETDYAKALKKEIAAEWFGGVCPYCHRTHALFNNKGNFQHGKHFIVKGDCSSVEGTALQGCGREAYILVSVMQEGGLFSGVKYIPQIRIIKPEELAGAFQPVQLRKPAAAPEPDPPKQPSGQGSKLKPPSPGFKHEYRGYTVVPYWEHIPYENEPSHQLKKFARQFHEDKK